MGKRLFVTGQTTLHWGRLEYGNIGNYYIVEPMFFHLRRVFPLAEIATTLQFSSEFCKKYDLVTVPMECYFDFNSDNNLEVAKKEYESVISGDQIESRFIKEVIKSDLVIEFAGDIWGRNADSLGKDRFETGLYKDLVAQTLKPTIMIASSPGPFNDDTFDLARKVYEGFTWVSNREPVSTKKLVEWGFNINNTIDFACSSFLFEKASVEEVAKVCGNDLSVNLFNTKKLKVGVILCGFNFERGPFNAWPREESEYNIFANVMENIIKKYDSEIILLSHSNGFKLPRIPFTLINGKDYDILEQLRKILIKRGFEENVTICNGIYSPKITKGIISNFDILISGRVHGAVAGLSQCIPTLIVDYGHEPKAHKLQGFAELCNSSDLIADPANYTDFISKTEFCIANRTLIRERLENTIPKIKESAVAQFEFLKRFVD